MQRPLRVLSLLAALVMPASAQAQSSSPLERTKELKDAEKFYTSALLTKDTLERKTRLERALNPLQQAMAKDPGNARVWLMAGQVYAGLHDFERADSAFDKAELLHPPIVEEVTPERLNAWAELFNIGVTSMDAQKYDEAIAAMEAAEAMYAGRPESKINLGALYSNKGDIARAEAAFSGAVAVAQSAAREKLTPEEAAQWQRYAEIGRVNVAGMVGRKGVAAFQADRFDEAIGAFRQARMLNPHARDYSYNLAQTFYAKTRTLEQLRGKLREQENAARTRKDLAAANAKAAEAKRLDGEINAIYAEIEPLVTAARVNDPNNEDLFLMLMRSFQMRGAVVTDPAAKVAFQKRGDELLKLHEAMVVELMSLTVAGSSPEVAILGKVRNIKLTAGAAFKIHITLIGLDGNTVGDLLIPLNAPAANATTDFEMKTKVTGEVAGWKYVIE